MTHSYVQMPRWHVTRLSHMRHKSHSPVLYVYACVSPFGSGCKGLCKRPESISSVTWLIGMCAMTQIHTCHDSSVCGTRLRLQGAVLQRHKAHVAWHGSFACMPWLMCACVPWLRLQGAVLQVHEASVAWLDFFANVLCLICTVPWFVCIRALIRLHMCHDSGYTKPWYKSRDHMLRDVIHFHVCHDAFSLVSWLIYMCAMTHLHVCHDSFARVMQAARSCVASPEIISCMTWLILNCMCVVIRLHVCHESDCTEVQRSHKM